MPILTLTDAKRHLNLTSPADDAEIQSHIDAAAQIVAKMCGAFDAETVIATIYGGGYEVALPRWPVASVTSVVPILTSGQTVDATDIDVDESGVARSKTGKCFPAGQYRWTYQASQPTVPAAVTLATAIIVKHLWETQRGTGAVAFAGGGEPTPGVYLPLSPGAVPIRAQQLLAPYLQVAGFA